MSPHDSTPPADRPAVLLFRLCDVPVAQYILELEPIPERYLKAPAFFSPHDTFGGLFDRLPEADEDAAVVAAVWSAVKLVSRLLMFDPQTCEALGETDLQSVWPGFHVSAGYDEVAAEFAKTHRVVHASDLRERAAASMPPRSLDESRAGLLEAFRASSVEALRPTVRLLWSALVEDRGMARDVFESAVFERRAEVAIDFDALRESEYEDALVAAQGAITREASRWNDIDRRILEWEVVEDRVPPLGDLQSFDGPWVDQHAVFRREARAFGASDEDFVEQALGAFAPVSLSSCTLWLMATACRQGPGWLCMMVDRFGGATRFLRLARFVKHRAVLRLAMKAAERWELDASGTSVLEAIRKSLVD